MAIIKIENLTFSYPASYDNVFENVSFQLDTDWKLGFVGRNGRGKTTLLKLLLGEYEYKGKIISSVQFDYFPYQVKDKSLCTGAVLKEVCPIAEEWEQIRELSYLGMKADVLQRPFKTLSNGEQTKVLLAALFLNEGHFLLIDEPTNHLDAEARKMVSAYLKKKMGFILVSHDRCFLDGCVDHILSLNRAGIDVASGSFSSWMENFERRQEYEENKNERLKKEIGRLQQSARQASSWSDKAESGKFGKQDSGLKADRGFVGHKAAKMMKRSKIIDERRQKAVEQKSELLKNAETAEDLKIFPLSYYADTLVSFSDVSVSYENRTVCPPVSFAVGRGERIAIDGRNGSGKSSLLKLIMGENIAHTGTVTIGSGLVISYVPQDTSHLRGVLSAFAEENKIDESLFKAILRKMDFERVQFEKDIGEFSAGQKKKVLIAKSLCEKAHLYVWDEPLNFIDIYSRMQIEKLIKEFSPSMVFVEHDSAFRNAVATRVVRL